MGKKVYYTTDGDLSGATITSKKIDTTTGETISEGVGFTAEEADRKRRANE